MACVIHSLQWARETGHPPADFSLTRSCVQGGISVILEIMARQARGTLGHSGDGERAAFAVHDDLQASEGWEPHDVATVHRQSGR